MTTVTHPLHPKECQKFRTLSAWAGWVICSSVVFSWASNFNTDGVPLNVWTSELPPQKNTHNPSPLPTKIKPPHPMLPSTESQCASSLHSSPWMTDTVHWQWVCTCWASIQSRHSWTWRKAGLVSTRRTSVTTSVRLVSVRPSSR